MSILTRVGAVFSSRHFVQQGWGERLEFQGPAFLDCSSESCGAVALAHPVSAPWEAGKDRVRVTRVDATSLALS